MNKLSLSKGFTLIELLVVIAILGILAAVVLVAINPAARIAEANDSGIKSNIGQIATAIEACFTNTATGNYDSCNTMPELTAGEYLKNDITGPIIAPDSGTAIADVVVYQQLNKQTDPCPGTETGTRYWSYHSSDGTSGLHCGTAATTP